MNKRLELYKIELHNGKCVYYESTKKFNFWWPKKRYPKATAYKLICEKNIPLWELIEEYPIPKNKQNEEL